MRKKKLLAGGGKAHRGPRITVTLLGYLFYSVFILYTSSDFWTKHWNSDHGSVRPRPRSLFLLLHEQIQVWGESPNPGGADSR